MRRVLVTGANGFVGRNILQPLCDRKYEIHATHAASQTIDVDGVTWHQIDLLDSRAVANLLRTLRPTHLVHLAWYAEPGIYWTSEKNLDWLKATIDLVRAFSESGGHRFVGAGTCAEYDWSKGFLREGSTPERPSTLYGACKHAAATAVLAFSSRRGFSAAWGRIFFMYGPHEHPQRLVASVIGSLLKEEQARCTTGQQRRDFLHVRDVGSAFAALLDSGVDGVVNIGSGEAPSIREIVTAAADALGRSDLLSLGAIPQRDGDPPLIQADVSRLRDEVGWRPAFTLDTGLRDTISWFERELEGIGR